MAQITRAVLFATAMATTFAGRRSSSLLSQLPASCARLLRITAIAPINRRRRREGFPALEMAPCLALPPLLFCFGVRPHAADRCRAEVKFEASPIVATTA